MEANTLMSIRKIKAQKGQKNKSYRDLKSDQKNKRIILENQNIKTCAHDRPRECSAEKISALVTSEQKPPASGTNTLGRTHDCELLGTASVSKFGHYTT